MEFLPGGYDPQCAFSHAIASAETVNAVKYSGLGTPAAKSSNCGANMWSAQAKAVGTAQDRSSAAKGRFQVPKLKLTFVETSVS